jgi:hypothetical protein
MAEPLRAIGVLKTWQTAQRSSHELLRLMNELKRKKKTPRGYLRRSTRPNVTVTCHKKGNEDGGPDLTNAVLDLSEAGARLLVTAPLDVGEEVVLGVKGAFGPDTLTRHGKVVWSFKVTKRGYAVGVLLEEHLACDDFQEVTIRPVRLDY